MSNFGELENLNLNIRSNSATCGFLTLGAKAIRRYPCALGRGGLTAIKKEGDGKTPIGCWQFKHILYRPDRIKLPLSPLPISPIEKKHGWCDEPGDRNYNRPVKLPYPASAENLFRDDEIYDVIIILNHNQLPRIQGRGSAIFMHIAKPDLSPTEGCIALKKQNLLELIKLMTVSTQLIIGKRS